MAINTQSAVDVPIELFGGLNTEIGPSDLPAGLSPANQDVVYLPGSVASRPCFHKVFANPFSNTPTVVYFTTYVQPNGEPLNLYFDSNGVLWKEDVVSSPGVRTQVATAAAGSYAKSVTAFGREYFAFSDGLHGTDIPRQYDGTNFDRVTQDGPAAAPSVANLLIPATTLSGAGAGVAVVLDSAVTTGHYTNPAYEIDIYRAVTYTSVAPHGFAAGNMVTIAGMTNAQLNLGLVRITSVPTATTFVVFRVFSSLQTGTGGTATPQAPALGRTDNIVTGTTGTAHGLAVGYQVKITGVANTAVGGTIASVARASGVATCTTTAEHGLVPGAHVAILGAADASFNTTDALVTAIPSPTSFTYSNGGTDATAGAAGTASTIWNGSFYVQSVPTTTTFTYYNLGPNTTGATAGGQCVPSGQCIPGQHGVSVAFLTRQGYITKPSPVTTFVANGGQYVVVSDLPIGPSNVVGRVILFTGAGGADYFFIPVPARSADGSYVISTGTVVNDNTSTTAVLDFADVTLFAALGADIDGNDLFAQVVLGGCLGVFAYADRMFWWGERNKIQNLLNMGFDGGWLSATPTVPLGWSVDVAGGALVTSGVAWGAGYQITGTGAAGNVGQISQSAYADEDSVPVLTGDTQYTFRCWAKRSAGTTGSLIAEFHGATGGSIATATIAISGISTTGGFVEADFSAKTGATIPTDAKVRIYATGQALNDTVTVDEMELDYSDQPFRDSSFRVSYVLNPEAFDGVTGVLGPASDPAPLRNLFIIRDSLYIQTGARLHQTQDDADNEPADWTVRQVADKCGAFSAFSTVGDKDWAVWAATTGLQIFDGGVPFKISQEIQTRWDAINPEAQQSVWIESDPVVKRFYIGVPTGAHEGPDSIEVLDYRELESGSQVASSNSLRISLAGKMIASDLTRKWTHWNLACGFGRVLNSSLNGKRMIFGAGSGDAPGDAAGFGNVYYLDADKLTDDDYGAMSPYYVTYAFVNHEQEQQLGTGCHRKLAAYLALFASGVGNLLVTPYADTLTNAWRPCPLLPLDAEPTFDLECGLNVLAERIFFRIEPQPITDTEDADYTNGTDVNFDLNKLVVTLKPEPIAIVRGAI